MIGPIMFAISASMIFPLFEPPEIIELGEGSALSGRDCKIITTLQYMVFILLFNVDIFDVLSEILYTCIHHVISSHTTNALFASQPVF